MERILASEDPKEGRRLKFGMSACAFLAPSGCVDLLLAVYGLRVRMSLSARKRV